MKNQIFIAFAMLFPLTGLAQKLTKEEKALQKICEEYTETTNDPFDGRVVKKVKPIRCGKVLYMSAKTSGDSVIMVVKLSLKEIRSGDVTKTEAHEFSLYNSEERKVIGLMPIRNVVPFTDVHKMPPTPTSSGSTTYYTVYEISYYLSPEMLKEFTSKSIKAVRMRLGSDMYTTEVDNEERAQFYRDGLKCISK